MTKDIIRYMIGPGYPGNILIAQSAQGLCALLIEPAPDDLKFYFPEAELIEDPANLHETWQAVAAWLEDPAKEFIFPQDIRGTDFQKKVWEALVQIPYGQTSTYGAIAEKIGAPKAIRAVGTACGSNKIALIIPCHRVLGQNGKLSGYRWGLKHKEALLQREKIVA
jgi:AraC family transcriptional regulator of adaptative response/methylated-DNA-[protein]-cysteine methyltransferase